MLKFDRGFRLVLKGAFYNVSTNLFGSLLSLAGSLLIAKYFGSSVIGTVAIMGAVISLMQMLANGGLAQATVRLIPEYRNKLGLQGVYGVYTEVLRLRVPLLLIVVTAYLMMHDWVEATFFRESPYPMGEILYFSAVTIMLGAFFGVNMQTLRGAKKLLWYNLLELSPRVVSVSLILAVIAVGGIPEYILYAKLLDGIITGLLSIFLVTLLFKHSGLSGIPRPLVGTRKLLGIAFPIFITSSVYLVMNYIDILMLGSMTNEAAVGIYQVAVKITVVLTLLFRGVSLMAVPMISELYHSGNMTELRLLVERSRLLLLGVSLPIYLILLCCGTGLLGYFGGEFEAGYVVLITMASTGMLSAWYGLSGKFMQMTGHQGLMGGYAFAAMLVNIGLNALLIPSFGIEGAAFATLVSTFTWNVLASGFIMRRYGILAYPSPELFRTLAKRLQGRYGMKGSNR